MALKKKNAPSRRSGLAPGWYVYVYPGTPDETTAHERPFSSEEEARTFLAEHREYILSDAGYGPDSCPRVREVFDRQSFVRTFRIDSHELRAIILEAKEGEAGEANGDHERSRASDARLIRLLTELFHIDNAGILSTPQVLDILRRR